MKLNEPFVITISRELGSGGRTIGRKLAEKLGVRYSDKNLIQTLVSKFNLTTFEIEKIKARKPNWFEDFVEKVAPMPRAELMLGTWSGAGDSPIPHATTSEDLFAAESQILEAIANEGSCVIAGRSGFFVLEDHPNKIDIFIRASRANRIARVMRRQNLSEIEATTVIDDVDKGRETYIQRYTGTSRYDLRNYDLVINTDGMSEDDAVQLIFDYIKHSA